MDEHLFSLVPVPPNRTHVLDGTVPERFVPEYCATFDRWIEADGGLDLQLLGIGRNGHIGFNEPCQLGREEALQLATRVVALHPFTVEDGQADLEGTQDIPRRALTLGVKQILAARTILLLALGRGKAEIVSRAIEGPITPELPASLLRTVGDRMTWILDEAAAGRLS
jgi:glucosamine-6-phosphate deaminase